jgi:hypothetical protein
MIYTSYVSSHKKGRKKKSKYFFYIQMKNWATEVASHGQA